MFIHMKQILVELDDDVVRRLEEIAPARSRQRSAFIRAAIARALSDVEEERTHRAYRDQPDGGDDAYFDPRVWEPSASYRKSGKKQR
jgi:hypothetical protein